MAVKKKEVTSKLRKEGDFIPPDGGWGWMIVVAAGFSNVSPFPICFKYKYLGPTSVKFCLYIFT